MKSPVTGSLEEAYGYCRQVAKSQAKNFYYSFRVLPKAKSDAMCAVYAFMRRADDISDDETKTVAERRVVMAAWIAAYRTGHSADEHEDMVFCALRDTQKRFGIGDDLLEQLVQGTAMDLDEAPAGVTTVDVGGRTIQTYGTFEDLYRYCYLVASVVGLVCIRIFGYKDVRAELFAERTGIAFQLTNILRDVKEDAERGRIYLPQDLLAKSGVTNEDVLELAKGRAIKLNERAMISTLSTGAWEYYDSAQELLPLIDADSRAALWVLVDIYSRLLEKIDGKRGDVFTERVRVPTRQKMVALVKGGAMALRQRVS